MTQINFKEVNMLISLVSALDAALIAMPEELSSREKAAKRAAKEAVFAASMAPLEQIPIEELRRAKAGIRIKTLKDAGCRTLRDLAGMDDDALMAINGIGPKQVSSIREMIAGFRRQIADSKMVRLSLEDDTKQNRKLIRAIASLRLSRLILTDTAPLQEEFHRQTQDILPRIRLRSSFRWLFSGRKSKDSTVEAIDDLTRFSSSTLYERAARFQGRFHDLERLPLEEAKKDFEKHSAEYYIILEKMVEAATASVSTEWIRSYMEKEYSRYLPAVVVDPIPRMAMPEDGCYNENGENRRDVNESIDD